MQISGEMQQRHVQQHTSFTGHYSSLQVAILSNKQEWLAFITRNKSTSLFHLQKVFGTAQRTSYLTSKSALLLRAVRAPPSIKPREAETSVPPSRAGTGDALVPISSVVCGTPLFLLPIISD